MKKLSKKAETKPALTAELARLEAALDNMAERIETAGFDAHALFLSKAAQHVENTRLDFEYLHNPRDSRGL
jgi:hypothetical protein